MLQYPSVVKVIYKYRFSLDGGYTKITTEALDRDYLLLENSSYIDESSLSKRRNGNLKKPKISRVREEYSGEIAAKRLIKRYKSTGGLNARLDKESKLAIIDKLSQMVEADSDIDNFSKNLILSFVKPDNFPEFLAACLVLSITQEPLQNFWSGLKDKEKKIERKMPNLVSLTPDLVFSGWTVGRNEMIEEIVFRLVYRDHRIQLIGMGGIGKTEILRGVYNYLCEHIEEHDFDFIGFFNYTGDLGAMLVQQMYCDDGDTITPSSLDYLRQKSRNAKVLLIIDDVRHGLQDKSALYTCDPLFDELLNTNISILLASRAHLNKDFSPMHIGALPLSDCVRIFQHERNLYEAEWPENSMQGAASNQQMSAEDEKMLYDIFENRANQNTLVIARLGAIARNYEWSIPQLNQELIRKDFNIRRGILDADNKNIDEQTLQHEINKLYDLGEIRSYAQRNILEGFSKIASAPLDMDTCVLWLSADAGVKEDECRVLITDLAGRTWLQRVGLNRVIATLGYSMHSVVKSAVKSQSNIQEGQHQNLTKLSWGDVTIEARPEGAEAWHHELKVAAIERLQFRIHFLNTGIDTMRNVCFRVILPSGVSCDTGTVKLYNAKHPNGVALSDSIVTDGGMNIGDYAPGGGVWIYFFATINVTVADKPAYLSVLLESNGGYITKTDSVGLIINVSE